MVPECTGLNNIKRKHGDNAGIYFNPDNEPNALIERQRKLRDFLILKNRKHKRWVYNLKTEKWEDYKSKLK